MINVDTLAVCQERIRHLQHMAAQDRLARQARLNRPRHHRRSVRRRAGLALIAAGQLLAGQPPYAAYEEALAVADRP